MGMLIGTKRALLGGRRAAIYSDKVMSYGPIAYWMLAEASGTDAFCQVDTNQNGLHSGVTLGQPGIGDGKTCPLYDGVNDRTNIYTATFASAFDGAEGTVLIWGKVSGVGVWTDSTDRTLISLAYDDSTNRVRLYRHPTNNILAWVYEAGDVSKVITIGALSDIDWMPLVITWSKIADQMKAFKDGAQVGATQTSLGTWAGALSSIRCYAGERVSTIVTPWDGYLAHCAVWDTALSPAEILDLSVL